MVICAHPIPSSSKKNYINTWSGYIEAVKLSSVNTCWTVKWEMERKAKLLSNFRLHYVSVYYHYLLCLDESLHYSTIFQISMSYWKFEIFFSNPFSLLSRICTKNMKCFFPKNKLATFSSPSLRKKGTNPKNINLVYNGRSIRIAKWKEVLTITAKYEYELFCNSVLFTPLITCPVYPTT